MNPGRSARASGLGGPRRTGALAVADVGQTGQTAGQLGQAAVGEELVDGGGLGHAACGGHRHSSQQSAAADGAQHLALGPPRHHLWSTDTG